MTHPVVKVEGLSKEYVIGGAERGFETLAQRVWHGVATPFRRFRQLSGQVADEQRFWALDDVSFEVGEGEVLGIIGRNGAGKSTLLKILSRVTAPTRGRAAIKGRVASLLEVGTGFHGDLTGRENIYLNGAILGMSRAEIGRQFDEIVAFAEIDTFIDTPVKRYSSGMYVRLAFAVAAHLEPEILIVDEVLAVGDAGFQKKCLAKLKDSGRSGRTILFVSHDVMAVTRLCNRTILLHKGHLIEDGPSEAVVAKYLHSDATSPAMRDWPDPKTAPGNDLVRLVSVRATDQNGTIKETFEITEPVFIMASYHNYANDRFPFVNIQLYDDNGLCVFTSGDFVNRKWRRQPRNFDGLVTSTCTIPANFLSEGYKRILVAVNVHTPTHQQFFEVPDAVAFSIVDHSEGEGARGEFPGNFPGIVRPMLDWRISLPGEAGGQARP